MKHYTIFWKMLKFSEIFFSKELFFSQGKERIFWNVFWKILSFNMKSFKINQSIDRHVRKLPL
jgi:hypothetical protein